MNNKLIINFKQIENALLAIRAGDDDFKESFDKEMELPSNQMMLSEVNMTVDELWEIVQYLATIYYEKINLFVWRL